MTAKGEGSKGGDTREVGRAVVMMPFCVLWGISKSSSGTLIVALSPLTTCLERDCRKQEGERRAPESARRAFGGLCHLREREGGFRKNQPGGPTLMSPASTFNSKWTPFSGIWPPS